MNAHNANYRGKFGGHWIFLLHRINKNGAVTIWFWSYIKRQRKDNFGVASLRHTDNAYNDNQTKEQDIGKYEHMMGALNPMKCKLTCEEVEYLGHVLIAQVLKPNTGN